MLAIRLQRTGRKGHAMFRMVVQDSRRTPTSGKIVANLGTYDPHAKNATLDAEKAAFYLTNGAQPSPRAVRILTAEGVKLPDWVKQPAAKTGVIRNADKLRRNQTPEPVEEAPAEAAPAAEVSEEAAPEAAAAEPEAAETPASDTTAA